MSCTARSSSADLLVILDVDSVDTHADSEGFHIGTIGFPRGNRCDIQNEEDYEQRKDG